MTIDEDTFTVGECVLTWLGVLVFIVLLGVVGSMEQL